MTSPLVPLERETDSHSLPQRSRLHGPVSTRRQRRTLTGLVVLAIVGLLPSVLGLTTWLQALGLGLALPGGGFLLHGGWGIGAFVLTLVLFLLTLVGWFATGNVIAPVAVWLAAAGLAAGWSAGDPLPGSAAAIAVAAVVVVLALLTVIVKRCALARSLRKRTEREAYLPAEIAEYTVRRVPDATGVGELDERQLAHVRRLLDLGLQPADEYAGFDVVEQFQPSALRYQFNHAQYALAQVQRHYTPAYHGALSRAQENLIERLTERKVWGYWRLERLWGRLSLDYDPAALENIMLTGYAGISMNTYSATTGSTRFAGSDALEFSLGNPRKTYRHGAESFNRSLLDNFSRSDHTLYPCEPNWTYSSCNLYGVNSVASYDAAFGTEHLAEVREALLHGLRSEFMSPAGDLVSFRSDKLGFGTPAGGGITLAQAAGWARPVFPQTAEALWAILCREVLDLRGDGLERFLEKPLMADPGNYRNTGLFSRALLAFSATELGDTEVAAAAVAAMERFNEPTESDGARHYGFGSTFANAVATHALVNRPGDWADLITGTFVPRGPVLADMAHAEATVAQAVSDGRDLVLVLHPAPGTGPGTTTLHLTRLEPGRAYRVTAPGGPAETGTEFTAEPDGTAQVTVRVDGRTRVQVDPRG